MGMDSMMSMDVGELEIEADKRGRVDGGSLKAERLASEALRLVPVMVEFVIVVDVDMAPGEIAREEREAREAVS